MTERDVVEEDIRRGVALRVIKAGIQVQKNRNRWITTWTRRVYMTDATDELGELSMQYNNINEFVIAGEFGFQRVPGPFEVEKEGTVWGIVVPDDAHPTVRHLSGQEGESAVIIADGEAVGGGILTDVVEEPDHDELHVLVDQYAMGE